jgi:transketolase
MQDMTAAAIGEVVRARDPGPEPRGFDAARCCAAAKQIRRYTMQMSLAAGPHGAHAGGALSMVEILSVLYLEVLRYDVKNPLWEQRDRFILSKGHGAPSLYATLCLAGFLEEKELLTFKANVTRLYGHPSMDPSLGIEFSSGSLGQGLSLGVGTSLALRSRGNDISRVFVLLSDGECNEGSVWEAAMSASHFGLSNLVAIIDRNGMQYDGFTAPVMNTGDLAAKWRSFGWIVREIDGHDVTAVHEALTASTASTAATAGAEPVGAPLAIIAHTIRGKGVSFMENARVWHHSRLTQALYDQAMAELDAPAEAAATPEPGSKTQ